MSDEQIENSGINFTYDDHGHPELGNVSKAHIFNILLQQKLKDLGIKVKSRPVELGYELRCVQPAAYDLLYCGLLGYGVKKLFDEGRTGCMVTASPYRENFTLVSGRCGRCTWQNKTTTGEYGRRQTEIDF